MSSINCTPWNNKEKFVICTSFESGCEDSTPVAERAVSSGRSITSAAISSASWRVTSLAVIGDSDPAALPVNDDEELEAVAFFGAGFRLPMASEERERKRKTGGYPGREKQREVRARAGREEEEEEKQRTKRSTKNTRRVRHR